MATEKTSCLVMLIVEIVMNEEWLWGTLEMKPVMRNLHNQKWEKLKIVFVYNCGRYGVDFDNIDL